MALAGLFAGTAEGAPATKFYCADKTGANKAPVLSVSAEAGHKLYLCAVHSSKKKGLLEVRGFKVFSLNKAGRKRPRPVFESEPEAKTFTAQARGRKLLLTELVWNGRRKAPGFESVLSCNELDCKAEAPVCVFKKIRTGTRKALQTINDYRHGKRQGTVPPPKVIKRLAELAYTGDAEALAAFNDRAGMALDGESAEIFYEHQEAIERLKKAGCFP